MVAVKVGFTDNQNMVFIVEAGSSFPWLGGRLGQLWTCRGGIRRELVASTSSPSSNSRPELWAL